MPRLQKTQHEGSSTPVMVTREIMNISVECQLNSSCFQPPCEEVVFFSSTVYIKEVLMKFWSYHELTKILRIS